MVKKITSELLPLTRELAKRFDEMRPLPGERPKRESRLEYFEDRLRDGGLQSPTWAIALLDGVEYRADGQHTSHLLATCEDQWFPQDQSVTVSTFAIESMDDAVPLFEIFDNPISARSNSDRMGVYLAGLTDLAEVDRTFLGRVARGIDYSRRDANKDGHAQLVTYGARSHGLYFLDEDSRRFALWLYPLHATKHMWMFHKPGIVAEMFADWSLSADLALAFWREVLTESNPDPGDETRELSTTLKDWSKRQPRIRQDKFRLRAKRTWERYRRLANARNASQAAD